MCICRVLYLSNVWDALYVEHTKIKIEEKSYYGVDKS